MPKLSAGQQASGVVGHPIKRYVPSVAVTVQHVAVEGLKCSNDHARFVLWQRHLPHELLQQVGFPGVILRSA